MAPHESKQFMLHVNSKLLDHPEDRKLPEEFCQAYSEVKTHSKRKLGIDDRTTKKKKRTALAMLVELLWFFELVIS